MTNTTTNNNYHISAYELAKDAGHKTVMEFIEEEADDCIVPACCKAGCMVEPDGVCKHGNKSVILEMGWI